MSHENGSISYNVIRYDVNTDFAKIVNEFIRTNKILSLNEKEITNG